MSKMDELLRNEKVEWKKLGDIGTFYGGITAKSKSDFINGNAKFITYKNVYSNPATILYSDEKVKINKNENQRKLMYGDIIFTGSSETPEECGMSSVITDELTENVYLNSFCFFLRLNNKDILLPNFSKHLFRSSAIRKKIVKTASGVTRFNVSKDLMKETEIPIPSLETQGKIVKILDKFTNYVTELQAELQARNKQYEYYRDMLLSEKYLNNKSMELFLKCNNSIKKCKLKNVAKITRGKRLVRSDLEEKGKFPVFQNSLKPLGYYYDKNFSGNKTCVISAGAAGEIFYRENDFWAADDVFVIDSDSILNKYIYYFLLSKQKLIKTKVRKASVPRLSREEIERLEILIPSVELQKVIVEVLDKFQDLLSDTQGLLPEEIEKRQKQYEYYREKLLTFDEEYVERERERERDYLSKWYLKLLKEAADIVGIEICNIPYKVSLKQITKYSTHRVPAEVLNEKNYVGVENLLKDKLGKADSSYVPTSGKLISFKKGDILIGNIRPYLRKIWIADVDGGTNSDVLTICIKEEFENKIMPKFLYQILSNESFFEYNIKFSKGAKMPRGDKKKIMEYEFVLPSLPVQEYIVSLLENFESLINDISQGIPKEIEQRQKQYEYYRDKLLSFDRD